jgi:hypothetical protein
LDGLGAHAVPDRGVRYPIGAFFLTQGWRCFDLDFGNLHAANFVVIEYNDCKKKTKYFTIGGMN